MEALLKRLKLVDNLTMEFPIERNAFVERLKNHVDSGSTSIFLAVLDPLRFSTNPYKGRVTSDAFKIRRRVGFFEIELSQVVAEGTSACHSVAGNGANLHALPHSEEEDIPRKRSIETKFSIISKI